jgi:hypothetical protein
LKHLILLSIVLLAGCDKSPSRAEISAEIKALCKSVGDKAFAEANDGRKTYRELEWIEQGAAAECELKYLTGK